MAMAGHGMFVVKRYGMNLAYDNRPDGQADE
jgi:hypothetical protein